MLPPARLLFRHLSGSGVGPPTVSLHEVTTVQVCCLQPVSSSVTHLASGSGRPQCHCTRCRLCRCAASCPPSLLPLTGPLGLGTHSVMARGDDFAGVLPPAGAIEKNARTREADQECLQLLVIRFHKLWNWKFTLQMNLIFQINTRQLFRPFGYSSVVSSTA